MCGISVIVVLGQKSSSTAGANGFGNGSAHGDSKTFSERSKMMTELEESLDMIAHRGPDSRGQWISENERIGMGHCRLAINDLTKDGHQPMHDVNDEIHVVVNGELYDYDSIRREMEKSFGYQFQGSSDSELLVALYKHYGLSCFDRLRGEFSFCLYDSRSDLFVAARDRYGIKPLFWTVQGDRLLVAAEAKAFLPLGWLPQWDVEAIVDDGWHFGCRTLFRGVKKVRPGHFLICTASGHIESRQYWDIDYPDKRLAETRHEDELTTSVRDKLIRAIRLRLRADVPVGIYLSGGIDSSAVAGIASYLSKEKGIKMGSRSAKDRIACFSVEFDKNSGFNESDIAARTAAWLDVKHYKLHMGEAEIAADLEEAVWHTEHHNQNLNFVGKFALSRLPRECGYPVVLTGEGADEQFAGYPMYVPDFLREQDAAWPMQRPGSIDEDSRKDLYLAARQHLEDLLESRGATHDDQLPQVVSWELGGMVTALALTGYQLPKELLAPWVSRRDALVTLANDVPPQIKQRMRHVWHPLHSALYAWSRSHLTNSILSCLGDRTEMAHSIEARTPFLDHELTEYVNQLPPSMKIRYDDDTQLLTEKYVLREAVKPFVLPELYERKKHAYTAPVVYPVGGPLYRLYTKELTQENVEQLGFVDWNGVKQLLTRGFGVEGDPKATGDARAMRSLNLICQWVLLGKRFGIAPAEPLTTIVK